VRDFFGAPFSLILLRKISENGAPFKMTFGSLRYQRLFSKKPFPSTLIRKISQITAPINNI
jgi:hypothetical protein